MVLKLRKRVKKCYNSYWMVDRLSVVVVGKSSVDDLAFGGAQDTVRH